MGRVRMGFRTTRPPDWRDHAACQGMDPAIFFDMTSGHAMAALAACSRCPVRLDCLEDDIATTDRASICGVRGGLMEGDRRERWRRRRQQVA